MNRCCEKIHRDGGWSIVRIVPLPASILVGIVFMKFPPSGAINHLPVWILPPCPIPHDRKSWNMPWTNLVCFPILTLPGAGCAVSTIKMY